MICRTLLACVVLLISLSVPSPASGQAHANAPWADEPIVESGVAYTELHPALWPRLFGEPFVADQSGVCLACNEDGTWKVLLRSPGGQLREVGTYVETVQAALPHTSANFQQAIVVQGVHVAGSSQASHHVSSGTLWIRETSQFSHVSGLVIRTRTQLSEPLNGSFDFAVLAITGTFADLASAEEAGFDRVVWSRSAAALKSEVFSLATRRGGGETELEPDLEGYRACERDARARRNAAYDRAWEALTAELNRIDSLTVGAQWGTVGLGVGTVLGTVGGACFGVVGAVPAGWAGAGIGAIVGTALGGIVGALSGATIGAEMATQAAWENYYEAVSTAADQYNTDVNGCLAEHGIVAPQ